MKTVRKVAIISLCLMIFLGFTAILGGICYLYHLNRNINYDENILIEANSKVEIFDIENNSLTNFNEASNKVQLSELPSYVPESFISIEDKNFYNHNGINKKRMIKAFISNIKSMEAKEGASTISQQLVKNAYLTSDKTLNRKIKEILITLKMEKQFSKEEILETYLNVIYFGNNSYGIEQASKNYFNKQAKDLSLTESALLAGMIKSPKLYSPIYNLENCEKRRNLVLKEMLKDNKISKEEYEKSIAEPVFLCTNALTKNKAFYEQATLEEASQILNISEKELASNGYKIFTYFTPNDQYILKNAINNENYYHKNKYGNIADSCGIILDNKTSGVTAFAGKSIYDIVNMVRSPGSSIKPILVYAPALENGIISPETPILDEETNFNGYTPHNVGNKYYGWISARKTIEKSLNVPAVKIMQYTGLEKCKNFAKKAGISFEKDDNNYALALGGFTKGLTVKLLVNSYTPFANNGKYNEAHFVRKICDKNGKLIYEHKPENKQIMSEETAYLLTDMLKSSTKTGTSSRLKDLPFDIAGKTGTVGLKGTNLNSDIWSIAYTSSKTCGVWFGNSTNEKEFILEGCNNGGTYPTSLIKEVFENLSKTNNFEKFIKPDNVEEIEIDSIELENNHILKLADMYSPEIFKEKALFNSKYKPTLIGESFNELSIVKLNVKLNQNKTHLKFNALPQCEYKIFRIEEDTVKLLDTIKNKKGEINFIDDSIEMDTSYEYFIEVNVKNFANAFNKKIKSNSVKVFNPSILKNNSSIINRNYSFR